jgi:tryptophanyl-tRNA synthetase
MKSHFTGARYGDLKKQTADAVVAGIEPIQKKYAELTAERGYLRQVLRDSAARVAPIANATVELVKSRMGVYTES